MPITETELPPQATGNSLPGQATAAADATDAIAPAPSPEEALLAASMGSDKGAQNYNALRAANQKAAPASPMMAMLGPEAAAAAPQAPSSGESIGAGIGNAFGALVAGLGGDPKAMERIGAVKAQAQKAQAAAQQMKAQAQTMAVTDASFLAKLKDQPLNMRAAMVQAYAAKQGRDLSAAEATYLANIQPDVIEHTIARAQAGDVQAVAQIGDLFSGDPVKMVTAKSEITSINANADKALADAMTAKAKAPFAAATAQAGLDKAKSDAERAAQNAETFFDNPERRVASEARAKGLNPGTPEYTDFSQTRLDELKLGSAEKMGALKMKQAAEKPIPITTTTRSMMEAAPKVRQLADLVDESLKKIETGPSASRYQEFMTGKVGASNPEFMRYRNRVALLSTLMMRMHVGARGSEGMLAHFKEMFDAGKQSADNMHAALEGAREYADIVGHVKEGEEVAAPGYNGLDAVAGVVGGATPKAKISAADFLAQ